MTISKRNSFNKDGIHFADDKEWIAERTGRNLDDALRGLKQVALGIPRGFLDVLPHPIVPNAGGAGHESFGWAAADHEHDGRHVLLDALLHTDTEASPPIDGAIIRGNGEKWAVSGHVTVFDEVDADGNPGFLNVAGSLPAVPTATVNGVRVNITGAGSAARDQVAFFAHLLAGYTGNRSSNAIIAFNESAGVGTDPFTSLRGGNMGIAVASASNTSGTNIGGWSKGSNPGTAGGAGNAIGFYAEASNAPGAYGIGLIATARTLGGADAEIGALIGFIEAESEIGVDSAGAIVDNGVEAKRIIIFRDHGARPPTTGPTATVCVEDGATMQYGLGVLTSGTLSPSVQGRMSGGLLHSYPWTTAQINALGAVTAGNIAAFTLPAKTVVKNAYLVLTGQGAGVTTLTVAVGRVAAAYDDYVVASDAKAAAGTVYGDAAAERGVNMTGFDLPNYAGTTLVNLHFISTGGNLNAVGASSGIVIIETALLP